MQGAGNDYVYVDCTESELENPSDVAVRVSDRHFGIGADGLILIKKSASADFFMEMYNADGSQGEMCGNGIRCVGKFVYDKGLTSKREITVETLAGIRTLTLNTGDDGKVVSAKVDMGMPVFRASLVPVDVRKLHNNLNDSVINGGFSSADMGLRSASGSCDIEEEPVISAPIEVNGDIYSVTCVSMGNPHAIVYVDKNVDIRTLNIEKIGPAFEVHPAFPARINTEFVQVVDRHNLNMRVWERGSGETLACGTGACASLVATVMNGRCDDTAVLHLLGGDLTVTWDRLVNKVYLEGPAVTVYEGEIGDA